MREVKPPDKYEVTYALPGKKTRVNADLKPTDIGSVRNVVFANFNHPPLGLEFLEDQSTAVITVKTFSYYDRVDFFRDFLDGKDVFMETTLNIIKNAKGIVSIRNRDMIPLHSAFIKERRDYRESEDRTLMSTLK